MKNCALKHFLLGYSWNKIGNSLGLKTLCDQIHLNEIGGEVYGNLV